MLQPAGAWYSLLPKNTMAGMFKDQRFMITPYPIVLVTEDNAQATSFQSYLAEQLALPILLVSALEALPQADELEPHPLFLVDLDYLKSSQQTGWPREISSRFGEANTVLLNAPTSTDRELLLMWPHTSGLFFCQDPLDRLVLGIRKVLEGSTGSRAICCAIWSTTTARAGNTTCATRRC